MFKVLTLQEIWESDVPVENDRCFKFKSTEKQPILTERISQLTEKYENFTLKKWLVYFFNHQVDKIKERSRRILMFYFVLNELKIFFERRLIFNWMFTYPGGESDLLWRHGLTILKNKVTFLFSCNVIVTSQRYRNRI